MIYLEIILKCVLSIFMDEWVIKNMLSDEIPLGEHLIYCKVTLSCTYLYLLKNAFNFDITLNKLHNFKG